MQMDQTPIGRIDSRIELPLAERKVREAGAGNWRCGTTAQRICGPARLLPAPGGLGARPNRLRRWWYERVPPLMLFFCEAISTVPQTSVAQAQSVCAEVKLTITQRAVIAGQAFAPTLSINNGGGSDVQQVSVVLDIKDASGQSATDLFAISAPNLSGLTAVDGTGAVAAGTTGSVTWTIRPTRQAALTNATPYFVGGTLSYSQNGVQITVPLYANSIQVLPEPYLTVKYFEERVVYSDDPFTAQVEPAVPFNLGILVTNAGYGTAKAFTISSGQPQIVDNEKGLLISFHIIDSQAGSNSLTPSLTLNLGDIGFGQTAFGRWLMTSSLQGEFTNFTASFQAVDDLGNTNLSLVAGVEAHALVHAVRVDQPTDDGLPDFLVNDIPSPAGLPDTVYLSNGPILPVTSITNAAVTGTISSDNMQIQLSAKMPAGWGYLQIPDPGQGNYALVQVIRSDGRVVRLGDDAWTTHRTLHPPDQPSYTENFLRIFDYDSPGAYTVTYGPLAAPAVQPPVAVTLAASRITAEDATLNGDVIPQGAPTTVYFEWGPTAAYGNFSRTNTLTGNNAQPVAFDVTGLLPETTYHFQLVASNGDGAAYGSDMTLVTPTLPPGVAPQITSPPLSQTISAGGTATFGVTASGTGPLAYQWQFNGANLADGARISGSTSNVLSVSALLGPDAGDYRAVVTNPFGSTTSTAATLTVNTANLALSAQPATVQQSTPTTVTFSFFVPPNPNLLLASPNLQRLNGSTWSVVGSVYDDGTHGDKVAGDGIYTAQVVLNEATVGPITFRASAAYKGKLLRVFSNTLVVNVEPQGSMLVTLSSAGSLLVRIARAPSSGGDGNAVVLSIPTEAGRTYVVERTDDLSSPAWVSIRVVPGDGTVRTVSDEIAGNRRRFYRVRVQ